VSVSTFKGILRFRFQKLELFKNRIQLDQRTFHCTQNCAYIHSTNILFNNTLNILTLIHV